MASRFVPAALNADGGHGLEYFGERSHNFYYQVDEKRWLIMLSSRLSS